MFYLGTKYKDRLSTLPSVQPRHSRRGKPWVRQSLGLCPCGLFSPRHQVGVGMSHDGKEAPTSLTTRHLQEPYHQEWWWSSSPHSIGMPVFCLFLKIIGTFFSTSLSLSLKPICLILPADTCVANTLYTINAFVLVNICEKQQRKSLWLSFLTISAEMESETIVSFIPRIFMIGQLLSITSPVDLQFRIHQIKWVWK